MNIIRAALSRIAGLFASSRADADIRDELQSHIDMETAENIRRGMIPEEARRRAMIASGGLTQAAEAVHDQRGLPWVEGIASDLRYAVRALRRTPAFTAIVVITLGLGIGANTAIFSVVRAVLLKPLPHRDGDRLVYLRHSVDEAAGSNIEFSVPEVRDYRAGAPSLGGIAEYSPWFGALESGGDAVRLRIGLVTGNFFEVMGLGPVLGRVTSASDDGGGVPTVIVLTHGFWLSHFGGDSGIVGKQLQLGGNTVTVIGVLQPAPYFPDRVDVFSNMVLSPHHLSALMVQNRVHRMTELIARLAPGATVAQARSEVAAVTERAEADNKGSYSATQHYRVAVVPFKEALGENARFTLLLLMSAAAFVLIISAANVANLVLMRGVNRQGELVVRAALGAGVSRLRRLLLAENLTLTLMGAALGIVIAAGGVRLLMAFTERYSARANEIALDGNVLAFALAVAVLLAILLSMIAALPREGSFASWISAGMRRMSGSLRTERLQRGLVIAQVAVTVVLLAGAGLLTRTMIELSQVSTGLRTEEVLTIPVSLLNPNKVQPGQLFAADVANKVLYGRMKAEARALPGVVDVGLGSTIPLRTAMMDFEIKAEGRVLAAGEASPRADLRTADADYFRASGIPVIAGRDFSTTDETPGARVVIVNRTLADKFFPGEDPVGKRIALTGAELGMTPFSGDWRTIVGVTGDTRDGGMDAPPRAALFLPFATELAIEGALVIRADQNAAALAGTATRLVRRIAPQVPVEHVLTVTQIKDESVAPRRLNAELVSLFGVLAVIIAAVGIAGVLAFSVSARTIEIGIRMSLGAGRGQVERMILREGGMLVGTGLVLGLAGAFFAGSVLRGLLFGVAAHDPVTLIGVALAMAAIGIVACWIPAARAARIDPAITMRQ